MPCFYHARRHRSPSTTPKVREAFRYIPDRQALINGASGRLRHARQRPLRQGLQVLRRRHAGAQGRPREGQVAAQEGRARESRGDAADLRHVPGFIEAATLFAQQAKAGGRHGQRSRRSPRTPYFDTSLLYTKIDFSQYFWAAGSLAPATAGAALGRRWNETHWKQASYDALIREAQGAPDDKTAEDKFRQLQQIQYDEGGYIIWTNINIVDATANYTKGLEPSSFTASAAGTTGAPGSTSELDATPRARRAPRRARAGARGMARVPGHCLPR